MTSLSVSLYNCPTMLLLEKCAILDWKYWSYVIRIVNMTVSGYINLNEQIWISEHWKFSLVHKYSNVMTWTNSPAQNVLCKVTSLSDHHNILYWIGYFLKFPRKNTQWVNDLWHNVKLLSSSSSRQVIFFFFPSGYLLLLPVRLSSSSSHQVIFFFPSGRRRR